MKTQTIYLSKSEMSGRSLIEVMIALTLGMLILIAITSLFSANKQTYRTSDDKTRMDEEGRLALNMMAFNIRMSGYGSLTSVRSCITVTDSNSPDYKKCVPATFTNFTDPNGNPVDAIRGCSGGFSNSAAAVINCVGGAATTLDAISTRYVVDDKNANVSGGAPTDCLGAAVLPSAGGFFIVENRFFIQNNPITGRPELYCHGNGTTVPGANFNNPAQPLTENVEQMVITYGIATTPRSQTPGRFLTAAAIVGTTWDSVMLARVCLVVTSANNGIARTPQSYRDCSDNIVTAPDLRLRGVYAATVAIRNRSTGAI
jgi:type IV pilus assembly protein PilW